MDPVSMMVISMGATAIGGGISAFGAYQGGQAQKAYYNYQAGVQQQLAQVANLKATRDIAAGEQEAQKYGIQTAQVAGGTVARAGAGNVATSSGSTALVRSSQIDVGMEEQASARQTAGERAYGEQVEAASKTASAGAMQMAGAQAATAGDIGAIGSIVSTIGNVAGKWSDMSKLGGGAGVTDQSTPNYPLTGPVTQPFLAES